MKNTILLLLLFFLISSCGESSTKGKWSESDLKECIKDAKAELQPVQEFMQIIEQNELSLDDVAECSCKQIEKNYSSYAEADKKIENDMSDEEAGMMLLDCMGMDFDELYSEDDYESADSWSEREDEYYGSEDGWPEIEIESFMNECTANMNEPGIDAEDYCSCMLYKVMEEFPNPEDALQISVEWMMAKAQECLQD